MLASAMSVPTTIVQVKKRGQFCSKLVQHEKVTTYSTKKEHCKYCQVMRKVPMYLIKLAKLEESFLKDGVHSGLCLC